ncbi:hypothetical protein LEN26_010114 [Aphanomyces euteiches]|nr:hypothetical protein LEN26_010114 [Aphanomyces euteiches]
MPSLRAFCLCVVLLSLTVVVANEQRYRHLRSVQDAPTILSNLNGSMIDSTVNTTNAIVMNSNSNSTNDDDVITFPPRPSLSSESPDSTKWLLASMIAALPLVLACIVASQWRRYMRYQTSRHQTSLPVTTTTAPPPPSSVNAHPKPFIHRLSSSLSISTPRRDTPAATAYSRQLDDNDDRGFRPSVSSMLANAGSPDDGGDETSRPRRAFSWASNVSERSDRSGSGVSWGRGSSRGR